MTDVIFRKHKDGEVFAIFPGIASSPSVYFCSCYALIGQHGSCDPQLCCQTYALAKPKEYRGLAKELRQRGYLLRIMKRMQLRHVRERRQQLRLI